ncbi:retron St85 family effector protein [Bacteriovorax sp. PP10]|uniref:Retron St85 family effector protein n=1 Tax=Bacteriovorax antarcticus TaxID=3088717 RepID=A0ABU5VVW7_9BACT|nr:retron St85 family effector protein [Bacteriovorax sp. PP10]MEA9357206.1 retron St85 family effector protein [Bacteriovorax sp. PP10]
MLDRLRAPKSALFKSVIELKTCIAADGVLTPQLEPLIFFVCGASRFCSISKKNVPSFRREDLINFLETNFKNTHPFLAEKVFEKLQEKQKRKNIYDLEKELFELSDFVIIVLESNSSFCELGAFSHRIELRKKLIVINDKKFIDSKSFINTGPLDLIMDEDRDEERVLWYKMSNTDYAADSIGDTYEDLEKLVNGIKGKNRQKIILNHASMSKRQMLFLCDLITLCGPIRNKEIIEILKIVFGNHDFINFTTMLALLETVGLISYDEKELYYSKVENLFFEYRGLKIASFKSAFRLNALRELRL